MIKLKCICLFSIIFLAIACSHQATRVNESNVNNISGSAGQLPALTIRPTTIVIDARPPFAYALSHIPGAVNVQWSDFSNPDSPFKGLLDPDLSSLARRLARLGVSPKSDVVVVGLGNKGNGEEGRMAWTLAFLGVNNVQFAAHDYFDAKVTTQIPPPRANAPVWDPQTSESLTASRQELLSAMTPEVAKSHKLVVIDVRPEKDYLGLEGFGKGQHVPDMNAINIDWHEFFTDTGRPDPAMIDRLKAVGIQPSQRIVVISSNGVTSAAATMALRTLGFTKAGNYPGGLEELLSHYKK